MAQFATAWQCHHCKSPIKAGEFHDCWTTTEQALTEDLSEELREAWERLREEGAALGEQRIYASGTCIMFSRKSCYFFVRPKRSHLEVCIFLGRAVRGPQVRRAEQKSKSKIVNILHIRHRDEVEAPVTDWLREAYQLPDKLAATRRPDLQVGRKGAKSRKHKSHEITKRTKRNTKKSTTTKGR